MKRIAIVFVLIALGLFAFWLWRPSQARVPANAALESLLIDDGRAADGFVRATTAGAVQFPRDFGPHEEYQTEWWYYTGNLQTENGREFGYQFTIFRRALRPESEVPAAENDSDWRTNQIYLAHFTISDIDASQFYVAERFSRDGADLAGAADQPYRVWLEDWSAAAIAPGRTRIQAEAEEVSLDIVLQESIPPVLHGDDGLSQKGPEAGNASYYYSIVQQDTVGQVTVGDEVFNVSGLSWKDHEYSTNALSPGSSGWDWFSLQLDNGAALMLYQIRREDGSIAPFSSGSFIAPDGSVSPITHDDWQLEVLDTWTSPTSNAEYPARWRLQIPDLQLRLQGEPLLANQELNVSTIYWEGAVKFSGELAGEPVMARGYVEMTGYAGTLVPS